MILLAIDTALEDCSVGLDIDGRTVLSASTIGRGHAEVLMPQVAALFAGCGIGPRDVTRIAVSVGPGSFTGLRVGIAAARGLALVTKIPVIGISTLRAHALAARGDTDRPILALLPARGDELFGQLFSSTAEPIAPPTVGTATSFRAIAERHDARTAGAGATLLGQPTRIVHGSSAPSLDALFALGRALDPADHPPKPLYIKSPDAAPQLRNRIARR